MTMTMYTEHMNIYINQENTEWLQNYKERGGSMSGLINNLMERHIHGKLKQSFEPPELPEKTSVATPHTTTMEDKLKHMQQDTAKYCKAGHLLPPGRERCTQKGCKWA